MTGSKNNLTWLAKPSQSKPKTQGIVELLMKSQLDFMPDQPASQPANQPTSHPAVQKPRLSSFLLVWSFSAFTTVSHAKPMCNKMARKARLSLSPKA